MKIHKKQSMKFSRTISRKIYPQVLILLLSLGMIVQPLAAQDDSATYSITFDATWSADSPHPHPDGTDPFPSSNAHFTSLIGAVHSADVSFWEIGGISAPGIESMAELGSISKLKAEVEAEIANGTALSVLNGSDVWPSPGTTTIEELQVTAEYPLITLVTMLAPSPDWFVGVSGLSLMGADGWEDEVVVELHGYDAGTEEGIAFSLGNDPTDPYAPIQQLSEVVLGKFTFTRTDDPVPPSAEDPLPDLTFESVTMDPPNPQIGDTVSIRVSILNQGDIIDNGFRVYLYWNPTDRPPTSLTEDNGQTSFDLGLQPGRTLEWIKEVEVTSEDLSYYVWVDRDNKVDESDEENNLYEHIATIPTPEPTLEPTPEATPEATPTPSYDSPDTYEEDDSCREANEIDTEGTAQMHNLYLTEEDVDGDHDWVQFEAVSGIKYHVVAQPHSEHGTDAMIVLEVTSDCESPPGTLGSSGAELIFTPSENGTHYILVRHDEKNYGPKTDYTLTIISEDSCIDIYEPNDSCPRSNDLRVGDDAQTYRFCQPNDIDWMQFEGRAGLEYKVAVESLGGNAIAQIEVHGSCTPGPSALSLESLQFHALADGPIYLRLANREGSRYGPDTEYTVQVEQVGDSACGPDEYEEDDTLSDAREIDIASGNFTQAYNVCPANDADWSRFQATAGKTYLIETIDLGDVADPVICLYDSEQALVQCDTDSGSGSAARLVWQAESDGTYYLQVHDEDDGVAGPETAYTLHVTTNLCQNALHEPNDDVDQAGTIIQDNEGQRHTFCQEGDEDWIKFEASAGKYVITAASQNPVDVDTVLALYDGDDNLLGENNDHGAGFGSMLEYEIATPGTYYILAYAHDPDTYGGSVEYDVRVQYEPSPTPTPEITAEPTPSPTPTPTSTPPPPSTEIRTLILVNQKRLSELYDEDMAAQVQEKLEALAGHQRVQGEIIQLHDNDIVRDAYAAWQANLSDVQYANQVADAIKRLLFSYMDQHSGIEYVVLVGDDRALPFRRVLDPTSRERRDYTEREYAEKAAGDHPTAASLLGDYILTDDFYIDLTPEKFYVPDVDLAVGRLIETPTQIVTTIDQFLGNPNTTVERVLVTGYDFLIDAGENMCTRWQSDVTDTDKINCGLIGEQWTGERLRQAQTNETYQIQAINGHAFHDLEGVPDTDYVSAEAILGGTSDVGGSLLYTLGCHSGLNLPGTLDLAEAFISRGGTYIGNTGYGWGYRGGVGLSERLMEILTANLVAGTEVSIGKALTDAKNTYIMGEPLLNGYDEKVVQQVILYGLPMHHIETSASPESALLGDSEVTFTIETPSQLAPLTEIDNNVVVAEISVSRQADSFSEGPAVTDEGNFYDLDGEVSIQPDRPIIPAHYSKNIVQNTGSSISNARSAVVKSGRYTIEDDFEAIIASPYNEYALAQDTSPDAMTGWWPELPTTLRHQGNSAQVISHFAQYDAETRRLRLFEDIKSEVYFSDSSDKIGPEIVLVNGLYFTPTSTTTIKVGLTDPSGIRDVFVSWFEEDDSGSGNIRTEALNHEENSIRWQVSVDSNLSLGFFIQAVDGAGNVTAAHNDGSYYEPSVASAARRTAVADEEMVYLPLIVR